MSILTHPSQVHNPFPPTETATPRSRANPDQEAPDRGRDPSDREAPESGRIRQHEAPDAGEGRSAYVEHEFTRGRSQG